MALQERSEWKRVRHGRTKRVVTGGDTGAWDPTVGPKVPT